MASTLLIQRISNEQTKTFVLSWFENRVSGLIKLMNRAVAARTTTDYHRYHRIWMVPGKKCKQRDSAHGRKNAISYTAAVNFNMLAIRLQGKCKE